MNYKGYWKYDNNEDLKCGEKTIKKDDIIYVITKKDDLIYATYEGTTITVRYNNVVRFFVREYRRGHPPSKCGIGPVECKLCDIWMKKRNC